MKTLVELTREAGGFDATPKFLERFAELVRADEREACAALCDRFANRMMSAEICSDAIRAKEST